MGCLALFPTVAWALPPNDVLMVFSNNRFAPANAEVDQGFREVLAESAPRPVTLFAEFLDRPSFTGPEYERTVIAYLRGKYSDRPPAVIVAAGGYALEVILRHRARLFPEVPVVHLAIEGSYLRAVPPLPPGIVGTPIESDFMGTIQLALRLHPDTDRLVIVTGASAWDRGWEANLRRELARRTDYPTIEFLAGMPTGTVVRRLRELGRTDLVFTPGYYQDGAGAEFLPIDSVRQMVAACGAPVYVPADTYLGTGAVGGSMPTYVEMGRQAGRTVAALLDGAAPDDLQLPAAMPNRILLDWRQLRRWGVDPDKVPSDAILRFQERTFWEQYGGTVVLIIIVILLQAALIVALLFERRLRQRTAAALSESEQQMSIAARAAHLRMWILDRTRAPMSLALMAAGETSAPNPTDIEAVRVLDTIHPDDRVRVERAVRRAFSDNEELEIEYRVVTGDGAIRWIAARGRDQNGARQRMTGVAMDITARKEVEIQAAADRAMLTHVSRASVLAQLSASITHQLNQPLTAILGNAEAARTMLERADLDLDELRDICNDIIAEDNRAAEVIRRLSALYRRGEMTFAPLDLNELVSETLELVRIELLNRGVSASVDLASGLPLVDGDRIQLQQVLLNLILNAADAMAEQDASTRRLRVRTEVADGQVHLSVIDRGTGIAPADRDKVFDAFWTTKAGGMGIGLAICRSIVTAHTGTLSVEGAPEGGSIFRARWPMAQSV